MFKFFFNARSFLFLLFYQQKQKKMTGCVLGWGQIGGATSDTVTINAHNIDFFAFVPGLKTKTFLVFEELSTANF
jgi:hypothetical protein